MLADYHVHTAFSDDSVLPMEEAVRTAIDRGLEEICFTEHIDYGIKVDLDPGAEDYPAVLKRALEEHNGCYNCDCDAYEKEIGRCRELYGDRIAIGMGMEFGMQVHTIGAFQRVFDRLPLDFVILSCHQVENQEFWNYQFQEGRSQEEYNRRYYEEILRVARRFDNYSVLGHLDMIRRYDKAGDYPFANVRELVVEILRTVIAGGKGIEVNTSCFRYGLPDLTPSREILKLYRKLGGEIITIGSDAHTREWIGCRAAEIQAELKDMGYRYVYTFEGMRPVGHVLG